MKAFIIAEKSSLATNIVQALRTKENFNRKDGYYESNSFIVSWAAGHLFGLKNISDYEGEKIKWSDIKLPYVPENFEFKLKPDTKEVKSTTQYKVLKKLMSRDDINIVYNCGDGDREGQVIIDVLLGQLKNNKPVYRIWSDDQVAENILREIDKKVSNENFKNLFNEGIARTYLDWILGINETVYLTNRTGVVLQAGRILVPIVKKIYDRDMEIKNFVPEIFYQAESNEENLKITYFEKYKEKRSAESKANELNNNKTYVKEITKRDTIKKPKLLYNLTNLQKDLNKKYKMSADETMQIMEKLYLNKFTTYPRTDSQYMTDDEQEKAKKIILSLKDDNLEFKSSKEVFNSEKVEGHSAITPTTVIPDLNELSEIERNVYQTVLNRFKSNFCKENCIISKTDMVIVNGDNEFKLTGKSIKQKGLLIYEPSDLEKLLPDLKQGDEVKVDFKPAEKQTKQSPKMTEASLLSYLENPFRKDDIDENDEDENMEIDIKSIGLGTSASRAPIIRKAKDIKYIVSEKNNLSITKLGIFLIESIDKLHIDLYAEKTIQFSKYLKDVNQGKLTIEECINKAKNEIMQIVQQGDNVQIEKYQKEKVKHEVIGKCPKCGGNIYESIKGFYCEKFKDHPKCNFFVGKDNKFFTMRGKKMTKTIMKNLLKCGQAQVKDFKKKDGNGTYDSIVKFDLSNEKYINFLLDFKKK
ncbi:DNA topoisomerase [uncultured Clostridium sp.]|uniref:type IA DNA topoisomerase n=1 Tax=uncultured Clostridium sp. TaxID=59620 RepID=UPI0027DC7E9F|nr:DNA topoisomerase [uncultured Clostridium sp.]